MCFKSSGLRLRSAGRSPSRRPAKGFYGWLKFIDELARATNSGGPPKHHGKTGKKHGTRAGYETYAISTSEGYLGRFIVSHGHLAAFDPYILETRPAVPSSRALHLGRGRWRRLNVKLAVTDHAATSAAAAPARSRWPEFANLTGPIHGTSASGTLEASDARYGNTPGSGIGTCSGSFDVHGIEQG